MGYEALARPEGSAALDSVEAVFEAAAIIGEHVPLPAATGSVPSVSRAWCGGACGGERQRGAQRPSPPRGVHAHGSRCGGPLSRESRSTRRQTGPRSNPAITTHRNNHNAYSPRIRLRQSTIARGQSALASCDDFCPVRGQPCKCPLGVCRRLGFVMGADDADDSEAMDWEKPEHTHPIDHSYWIGRNDVTRGHYTRRFAPPQAEPSQRRSTSTTSWVGTSIPRGTPGILGRRTSWTRRVPGTRS
jgi:hypothetical protein